MDAVRNLTLSQAVARARIVDVGHYDVTLDLSGARHGMRRAAAARAATATAAAKAAAWERMTGGDAANWELESLLQGFHQPDQGELLAPYSQRYFADLADVFATLDGEMARLFAMAAFPRMQISEETVARADAWLAAEPSPTLRRVVLEGRDRLVRAIKAQACDRDYATGDVQSSMIAHTRGSVQ